MEIPNNSQTKESVGISNRSHSNANKSSLITQEKLLINYNKLKSKYENKVKENKFLKEKLDGAIDAIKTFEESYKSIMNIHHQVKDWIVNIKAHSNSVNNHEFSTSDISQTMIRNSNSNILNSNINLNTNNNNNHNTNIASNVNLLKKLEEFEIHYQEMTKNFNNLVVKYKMLKDDKLKMEDSSLKLLTRYSQLEKQHDETIQELYSRYDEIKRYKEVDKCLVDFTLNSFMLKVDRHSTSNMADPGIKCEPIPSFAKFLANKK